MVAELSSKQERYKTETTRPRHGRVPDAGERHGEAGVDLHEHG